MSTSDILEACIDKLEAFSYSPEMPVLWGGVNETPPNTGLWLQPHLFPIEPSDIAWDNDACVDTRGFLQVLVYFKPGQGVIEPTAAASAIIAAFPKGTALGPVRVLKQPWQSAMVTQDSSKLYIPVTIPYKGLT